MPYSSNDLSFYVARPAISLGPFSLGWENKIDIGKDLKKLCSEFESIFLTSLLRQMQDTFPGSDLLGNGMEGKIIKWLWTQTLSQKIAEGGGIGLGKMLYKELSKMDKTHSNHSQEVCKKWRKS